jgi:hypothetical protein
MNLLGFYVCEFSDLLFLNNVFLNRSYRRFLFMSAWHKITSLLIVSGSGHGWIIQTLQNARQLCLTIMCLTKIVILLSCHKPPPSSEAANNKKRQKWKRAAINFNIHESVLKGEWGHKKAPILIGFQWKENCIGVDCRYYWSFVSFSLSRDAWRIEVISIMCVEFRLNSFQKVLNNGDC